MTHTFVVTAGMNSADKIVFSRGLKSVIWKVTRLVNSGGEDAARQ